MSQSDEETLLSRRARAATPGSDNPWAGMAAGSPDHADTTASMPSRPDAKLDSLLQRIKDLTASEAAVAAAHAAPGSSPSAAATAPNNPGVVAKSGASAAARRSQEFLPLEPASIRAAGLTESEVEALMLKYLLSRGEASGRDIGDQIKLSLALIEPLLRQMKFDQLVGYRGTAQMNDYVYQLTDFGRERARRYAEHCTYCGAAPVALVDYVVAVKAQSLERQQPTVTDLQHAFADLLINPKMLTRLGPAINSGRGMFLYGAAGNGKTSIAERVTRAFGQHIWIPRALGIDGEIMRVFDPMNHCEVPPEKSEGLLDQSKIDRRWVRIVRPTIIVGGELTMENLEATINTATGISEAPVQLKSNCGTLVIDDFGRQKMRTDELLNRWIVPLEKRIDFLNLASGKKIQVPFDQLVIFSTNLQPKDLVDDAFLRRIPYKIEVPDPSEDEFRQLFRLLSPKFGFTPNDAAVSYLIDAHYRTARRQFRCCQPRDLLMQVRNFCQYEERPLELSPENFDFAVENYFAIME